VVLAGELATGAAGLLARIVIPHQLVAAVTTDVVEGVHLTVGAPDHHDRCSGRGDLPGKVGPGAGDLFHPADIEPGAGEDGLALQLVVLGRDRVLIGDRPGAQLGVVLGPAALVRLWKVRHVGSSRYDLCGQMISAIF
jgi:hypothetical protein